MPSTEQLAALRHGEVIMQLLLLFAVVEEDSDVKSLFLTCAVSMFAHGQALAITIRQQDERLVSAESCIVVQQFTPLSDDLVILFGLHSQ